MSQQKALTNWKVKDPFSASHLNEAWDMLRPLSNIIGGGGTKVTQFPSGTTVWSEDIPPTSRGIFPVRVVQVGGADGSGSSAATWTYDVYRPSGNPAADATEGQKIGTAVAVSKPRPNGKMIPGDKYGLAFYDGTTLTLWDAGEKEDTAVGCTA